LIAISQIKTHPPRRQSVKIGRLRVRIPIAAKRRLEVIDEEEQHIGAGRECCTPWTEHEEKGEVTHHDERCR
jgi:hypothetical protein